jgi:hypothetical protein
MNSDNPYYGYAVSIIAIVTLFVWFSIYRQIRQLSLLRKRKEQEAETSAMKALVKNKTVAVVLRKKSFGRVPYNAHVLRALAGAVTVKYLADWILQELYDKGVTPHLSNVADYLVIGTAWESQKPKSGKVAYMLDLQVISVKTGNVVGAQQISREISIGDGPAMVNYYSDMAQSVTFWTYRFIALAEAAA